MAYKISLTSKSTLHWQTNSFHHKWQKLGHMSCYNNMLLDPRIISWCPYSSLMWNHRNPSNVGCHLSLAELQRVLNTSNIYNCAQSTPGSFFHGCKNLVCKLRFKMGDFSVMYRKRAEVLNNTNLSFVAPDNKTHWDLHYKSLEGTTGKT